MNDDLTVTGICALGMVLFAAWWIWYLTKGDE